LRRILAISLILIAGHLFSQKFGIIGDFRYSATCDTINASELVKSWDPEFIVTVGDLSDPACNTIDHEIGRYFSDYIYPYYGAYGSTATHNRFVSTLGNHDQEGDGLTQYLEYFTLPGNERYYDTLIGNVHIFILNSAGTEPDGPFYYSIQGLWLESAMAESTAPWKLIFFHHPPYTSGNHGNSTWMQWPFAEWGATAVFSGHDHDYERLFVSGVYYFVAGIGGGDLRAFTTVNEYSLKRVSGIHGALLCNAYSDSLVIECISVSDSLLDRQVIFPGSTNVKQVKDDMFLYPNPITKSFSIAFDGGNYSEAKLSITDLAGHEILKQEIQIKEGYQEISFELSKVFISDPKPGVYLVSLLLGEVVYRGKMVIE